MHVRWNNIDKRGAAMISKKVLSTERNIQPDIRKNRGTHSDLYQAVFPIYHVGKLCGLVPVRFVAHVPGRYQYRLSVLDVIYTVCLLLLLIGAEVWGMWRDLKDGWENSTRLKSRTAIIATSCDVLGVMSLTSVCIVGSIFRWKDLQAVMDKLIEVDEKIGFVSPKKTRRYTIALTVCSLSYLWFISLLDIYSWHRESKESKKMDDKGPINYSPLYVMYTVIIQTEIQYSVTAYNIGERFLRLNKSLESILKSGRITDYFRKDLGLAGDLREPGSIMLNRQDLGSLRIFRKSNENSRITPDNIPELISIHSTLCDTIYYINCAFGVAVLSVMLTCLLHLIITPYFLILKANGGNEFLFLAVQVAWCIFHVMRMLIIVQPAYSTVSEGKKTEVLVSQLLSSSFGIENRKELEIFSLQLLHRPLVFSACGLFSLDRKLVTSIAGAVTTYLVILIQFQNADDTKGDFDILRNASQILKNASTYSIHNITALKLAK